MGWLRPKGDKMTTAAAEALDKTFTTKEVAEKVGMTEKALQYLVRAGKLTPHDNGKEGKQRRLFWTDADVEEAMQHKEDGDQSKKAREVRDILLDLLDAESLQNVSRARDLHCPRGSVVCAGPSGARVVRENDSVRTLVSRIGGYGIILPKVD